MLHICMHWNIFQISQWKLYARECVVSTPITCLLFLCREYLIPLYLCLVSSSTNFTAVKGQASDTALTPLVLGLELGRNLTEPLRWEAGSFQGALVSRCGTLPGTVTFWTFELVAGETGSAFHQLNVKKTLKTTKNRQNNDTQWNVYGHICEEDINRYVNDTMDGVGQINFSQEQWPLHVFVGDSCKPSFCYCYSGPHPKYTDTKYA